MHHSFPRAALSGGIFLYPGRVQTAGSGRSPAASPPKWRAPWARHYRRLRRRGLRPGLSPAPTLPTQKPAPVLPHRGGFYHYELSFDQCLQFLQRAAVASIVNLLQYKDIFDVLFRHQVVNRTLVVPEIDPVQVLVVIYQVGDQRVAVAVLYHQAGGTIGNLRVFHHAVRLVAACKGPVLHAAAIAGNIIHHEPVVGGAIGHGHLHFVGAHRLVGDHRIGIGPQRSDTAD